MGWDMVKGVTGTVSWCCPRWRLCQAGGVYFVQFLKAQWQLILGHMIVTSMHHVIVDHPHPQPATDTRSAPVFCADMVLSIHSDDDEAQVEEAEPGEDGYWPALEILGERKRDYLVNWDGIDPETGRAWAPSWTQKSEVTEDLIEVWEAKKALKKKGGRQGVLDSVWPMNKR
jgi:hypothetical protein